MEGHSDITLAGLIGAIMAALRAMERFGEWYMERRKNGSSRENGHSNGYPITVQLDPQSSSAIAEILKKTDKIESIVEKTDNDGVYLVYAPRTKLLEIEQKIEATTAEIRELRYQKG